MYRPPTAKQKARRERQLEAMRRGKETARMAREPARHMPELPELRRVVTVTDYDRGEPVTHTFELHRSSRVDSYRVVVDGQPWKRCGWSTVCATLRKSHHRLPSPRSDLWE
jgi:hypothetical protein